MRAIPKSELKLHGYSDRRIKELEAAKQKTPLAKREDLENLYAELTERRAELLADVKKNGIVIKVEKSNARGMMYHAVITNPAFLALRSTELQLVALAKLIGAEVEPAKLSASALIAATDKLLAERSN